MIDRLFAAVLTFCVLIGGTLAIASAMLGMDRPAARPVVAVTKPARTVQLERVVVVAQRQPAASTTVAETEVPASAQRVQ